MKKRFKSKKRVKIKFFVLPIIIMLIMSLFIYIEGHITLTLPSGKAINTLWRSGNEYSYDEVRNVFLSEEIYNYIKSNIFNSPINLLKNELKFSENEETVNSNEISFSYAEKQLPIVYIYSSHQGETYSTKYLENYNIVPDVLMASSMLKDKLENLNIPTLVEKANILSYMKENNLNHAGSYIASRHFLTKILNKFPNMKLYIDLHRDAVSHYVSTTNINGKECAKIMFVIGLEYDTYEKNLQIVTNLNNIILNKFPSLTRGILKKEGYGVNGVYNQDLDSRIILIEVGGNENNIEEINNTLELLAQVIGEYINEKE